jgi:hypothetical protein
MWKTTCQVASRDFNEGKNAGSGDSGDFAVQEI